MIGYLVQLRNKETFEVIPAYDLEYGNLLFFKNKEEAIAWDKSNPTNPLGFDSFIMRVDLSVTAA